MNRSLLKMVCFLSLLVVNWPASAAQLRVAVASNFLLPARAMAEQFELEYGHQVKISSGSTGKLYAQIIQGAPFDLFMAANGREPQRLVEDDLVMGGAVTYALGRLVLWSKDPELLRETDPIQVLRSERYRRLAVANPQIAPYGAAAESVITKLGLSDQVSHRMVRAESVAQVYQYVFTGNAELGFIAQSQLIVTTDKKGSYWHVPGELHPPIRQQAVVLKRSRAPAAAEAFLAYLTTPQVRKQVEAYGYGTE